MAGTSVAAAAAPWGSPSWAPPPAAAVVETARRRLRVASPAAAAAAPAGAPIGALPRAAAAVAAAAVGAATRRLRAACPAAAAAAPPVDEPSPPVPAPAPVMPATCSAISASALSARKSRKRGMSRFAGADRVPTRFLCAVAPERICRASVLAVLSFSMAKSRARAAFCASVAYVPRGRPANDVGRPRLPDVKGMPSSSASCDAVPSAAAATPAEAAAAD